MRLLRHCYVDSTRSTKINSEPMPLSPDSGRLMNIVPRLSIIEMKIAFKTWRKRVRKEVVN